MEVVYPLMQEIQGKLELLVRQQSNMVQGTLMSDGWTDMRGHHLINFLVNSPEGTYFLELVDASSQDHSATNVN